MLVCWARLGVAKDWLTPTWGPSGGDGVARIGYYLKGAILFRPNRSESVIAGDKGTWLSTYCLYRGVMQHNAAGQFILGKSIDANFERAWAPHESKKFGHLFGMLTRPGAPLADDERKRIVLATCLSPRDLSGAIEAELHVIYGWCEVDLPILVRSVRFNDRESIKAALATLRKSRASEAIFSARMKFLGYLRGEPKEILNECFDYIKRENEFAANEWRALWSPLVNRSNRIDERRFLESTRTGVGTIFAFGMCVLLMELSLIIASRILQRRPKVPTKSFLLKLDGFLSDIRDRVKLEQHGERLLARIDKLNADQDFAAFEPTAVWSFAVGRIDKLLINIVTDKEHLFMLNSQIRRDELQKYYSHMVWYDVIGSTGERFGLTGSDKDEHEKRVSQFKSSVTKALEEVRNHMRSKKGELFAWNGTVESRNDEKHLFIHAPTDAQGEFTDMIVNAIMRETLRFDRVRVRLIAIPCSFAGSEVWKFDRGTEVVGDRFWVHWARLKDQLKKSETKDFDLSKNILYFCTRACRHLEDSQII
jgi:hypothetical protein